MGNPPPLFRRWDAATNTVTHIDHKPIDLESHYHVAVHARLSVRLRAAAQASSDTSQNCERGIDTNRLSIRLSILQTGQAAKLGFLAK